MNIKFKQVKNDVNGNARYVCHYLNIADTYERALFLAKKIGGKKFCNKQFGGGIVFHSYDINRTEKEILEIAENNDDAFGSE